MNIKNTIIINLTCILIAVVVVLLWQNIIMENNKLVYETELEYQKTSYEKILDESIKSYSTLLTAHNNLWAQYHELDAGWELYQCTGYTSLDEGCNNISVIGLDILKWSKYFNFCAVDNQLIPYGSVVLVKFGTGIEPFLAVDVGGAVRGKHLDLYFGNDLNKAFGFGVKGLEVKIIK